MVTLREKMVNKDYLLDLEYFDELKLSCTCFFL